jgi:hypothetical protein
MIPIRFITLLFGCLILTLRFAHAQGPLTVPERKVMDGIATTRTVGGAPYELAGKRIVVAN